MTMPPNSGWTVPSPPPPNGQERPIRGRKVAAGLGIAAGAQVLAIGIGVLVTIALASTDNSENALFGVYLELLLQLVLFVACLVIGIVWIARRDRGLGLGILIGWAVSVIVFPVAGIGVCIAIVNANTGAS
ncbi:hypothetical protein ACFO1B_11810 [Dactylosporangium siamense]|uniref:DUF4064 domain-containing protein n=1 Tax=Dactylosporangium siamense TaxID=685454 RepID=A0A919UAH4_9ACTN|nr:hypothetical protein [Dactylosporangium siamense]GIG44486.1 hypothetical protein Dsi01nite_025270 [Dactylosporangium siamense]